MTLNWTIWSGVQGERNLLKTQDGESSWVDTDDPKDGKPIGQYVLTMPPYRVASDARGVSGDVFWEDGTLETVFADGVHTYLLCSTLLVSFFRLLLSKPNKSFTPLFSYGRHLIMGPRFDEHTNSCSACFAMSLLSNVPSLQLRWKNGHQIDPLSLENQQLISKSVDALITLRQLDGASGKSNNVTVLDMSSGEMRHEKVVLRICRECSKAGLFNDAFQEATDLVGEFAGAIRWIGQVEKPPFTFSITATHSEILDYRDAGGGVAESKSEATKKALYESIERIVINRVSDKFIEAFVADMPCLAHEAMEMYSDEQYSQLGFMFNRFNRDARYLWMKGLRLKDKQEVFLPADFVTAHQAAYEFNRLAPPTSTGTAAYSSAFRAEQSACLELIERDVVTRCWYKRNFSELDASELVPSIAAKLLAEGKSLRLYLCDDTKVAPVVVAAIYWITGQCGALGCSAGIEVHRATLSAIQNAASMFAHRAGIDKYLNLQPLLESQYPQAPSLTATYQHSALLERYDPIIFNLSPELLKKRNIHVIRAWSSVGVPFPSSSWPIPLKRWQPDDEERKNLEVEIDAF